MGKLILLRHGQSGWNEKNLFTGWVDVPLSRQGIEEALLFGKKISTMVVDVVFVSSLIRAQMTAMIALSVHSSGKTACIMHEDVRFSIYNSQVKESCIPVYIESSINERNYGKLQGLEKKFVANVYGQDRVQSWRRGFEESPPGGESLKMTVERVLPVVKEKIVPAIKNKKNVLVVAHGNSLRAIVMYLKNLSKTEIFTTEFSTGSYKMYSFDNNKWTESDDLS
jgi:2,3-bisphosphoglycerate-dependent phosphoglycerate mutase